MATRTKKAVVVDEAPEQYRISITIDKAIRRNLRIAAAHADMEVGDWSRKVLALAAQKATGVEVEA